jgi:hypothetical protein
MQRSAGNKHSYDKLRSGNSPEAALVAIAASAMLADAA